MVAVLLLVGLPVGLTVFGGSLGRQPEQAQSEAIARFLPAIEEAGRKEGTVVANSELLMNPVDLALPVLLERKGIPWIEREDPRANGRSQLYIVPVEMTDSIYLAALLEQGKAEIIAGSAGRRPLGRAQHRPCARAAGARRRQPGRVSVPDPGPPPGWWREAVVYQIYPRSFCDTSGDGVGDLDGVRRHLDHLAWLGVDALWLSPIFRSPMADHGYDVSDYCDVDPLFGSLATIDALIGEAHDRGLRVLLDWVPNHTSDQHPWFLASRAAPAGSPERAWYLWHEGSPDHPPTDWKAAFPPGPAWTWDPVAGAWYHHGFTPQQPDLDWNTPAVRERHGRHPAVLARPRRRRVPHGRHPH